VGRRNSNNKGKVVWLIARDGRKTRYVCNSNLSRFVVDYFSVFVSLLFGLFSFCSQRSLQRLIRDTEQVEKETNAIQ
jgi:hypothetical protein